MCDCFVSFPYFIYAEVPTFMFIHPGKINICSKPRNEFPFETATSNGRLIDYYFCLHGWKSSKRCLIIRDSSLNEVPFSPIVQTNQ